MSHKAVQAVCSFKQWFSISSFLQAGSQPWLHVRITWGAWKAAGTSIPPPGIQIHLVGVLLMLGCLKDPQVTLMSLDSMTEEGASDGLDGAGGEARSIWIAWK